jgi:hypothetical protein
VGWGGFLHHGGHVWLRNARRGIASGFYAEFRITAAASCFRNRFWASCWRFAAWVGAVSDRYGYLKTEVLSGEAMNHLVARAEAQAHVERWEKQEHDQRLRERRRYQLMADGVYPVGDLSK